MHPGLRSSRIRESRRTMQADFQVPRDIHQFCPRTSLPDHSYGHTEYPSLYPANGGRQSTRFLHECQFGIWVQSEIRQQLHSSPTQGGLWKRVRRKNSPNVQSLSWSTWLYMLYRNISDTSFNISRFKHSDK